MPVIGVDTPSLLLANGKFQEKNRIKSKSKKWNTRFSKKKENLNLGITRMMISNCGINLNFVGFKFVLFILVYAVLIGLFCS